MRISDWSSDVCSSDLRCHRAGPVGNIDQGDLRLVPVVGDARDKLPFHVVSDLVLVHHQRARQAVAHRVDRKSVVYGKSVSVRVDLGGRGFIKKTTKIQHNYNSAESHYT